MDDVCTLAVTGTDPAPFILVALGLLVVGAIVLLSTKTRRVAAVLLAGAVIAGVLVVPAQPASAADCSPIPLVTVADAATVAEDAVPATVGGDVAANDTAAPGRTIRVIDPGARLTQFGSIDFAGSGAFVYTLDNADAAVNALDEGDTLDDTIDYRVTDGTSTKTGSLTVTITGTTDNRAPVATDDAASVTEDVASTVSSNLLANDSDPDGDVLSLEQSGPLTLEFGALSISPNGDYTYTLDNADPAVNLLLTGLQLVDVYEYTVVDGRGGRATAALTVVIDGTTDNRAPVTSPDVAAVVAERGSQDATGNILANDRDPDGDPLTVQAITRRPLYGDLGAAPNGNYLYGLTLTDPAVAALAPGQTLIDTAIFIVSDGRGGLTESLLTITITAPLTNRPPVAAPDLVSITEDGASIVATHVLANDRDPDGNPLRVANPGTYFLQYGTLTINSNGNVIYALDNSNPTVNALNDGQSITDTFTYTVSDGNGATASSRLTITINGTTGNRAPLVDADNNTIKEDATPNTAAGNVLANDSDPDGQTLTVANAGTFELTYGSLTIAANGSYTYSLDNSNPAVDDLLSGENLTDTFTYVASDGRGATNSTTLTITIDGTTDD